MVMHATAHWDCTDTVRQSALEVDSGRLVHCATAVSVAVLGRVTRTTSVALLLRKTQSERSPNFAAHLLLPAHDLFWANLRAQLHLPPVDMPE